MLTVLTSDQPRHRYLINRLSEVDSVFAVMQTFNRVHTKIEDPIMDEYFERMRLAENLTFPRMELKAHTITTKLEGLKVPLGRVIVFGCEWIKGELYEQIKDRAINIHMGIGYRGASCNAHAIAEGRNHLVGATVQRLSKGLDCGEPLFYAYADKRYIDPFMFGMSAVKSSIDKLVDYLLNGHTVVDEPTDKFSCYKSKTDFTIEIAKKILKI